MISSTNEKVTNKEKLVIVGAGASGLLCAIALAEKGYQIELYERRSVDQCIEESDYSYPNAISIACQNVLKKYGAGIDSCEQTLQGVQRVYFDNQGQVKDLQEVNSGRLITMRHRIIQNLHSVAVSKKYQESIILNFGSKCVGVDFEKQILMIEAKGVPYDLLIACDGTNSIIRNSYMSKDKSYTCRKLSKRMFMLIDLPKVEKNPLTSKLSQLNQIYFMISPQRQQVAILWQKSQSRIFQVIASLVQDEGIELETRAKHTLSNICGDLNKALPKIWKDHLQGDPKKSIGTTQLLYPNKLHGPNTIFLGDAGHPITSMVGLGVDLAINDVEQLMQVWDKDNLHAIPQNYTKQRIYDVQAAQQVETSFNNTQYRILKYYRTSVQIVNLSFQKINHWLMPYYILFPYLQEVVQNPLKFTYSQYSKTLFFSQMFLLCGLGSLCSVAIASARNYIHNQQHGNKN